MLFYSSFTPGIHTHGVRINNVCLQNPPAFQIPNSDLAAQGAFLHGSSQAKATVIGAAMVLSGAYPIVTPHIWVALALIASLGRSGQPPQYNWRRSPD